MTQYHISKRLKVFGEAGDHAMSKEMKQFDEMDTIDPVMPNTISMEDKTKILEYMSVTRGKVYDYLEMTLN